MSGHKNSKDPEVQEQRRINQKTYMSKRLDKIEGHEFLAKWSALVELDDQERLLECLWALAPKEVDSVTSVIQLIPNKIKLLVIMKMLERGLIDEDEKALTNIFNKLMASDSKKVEHTVPDDVDSAGALANAKEIAEMKKHVEKIGEKVNSGAFPIAQAELAEYQEIE